MTLENLSQIFFNITFIFYIISLFFYISILVSKTHLIKKIGSLTIIFGLFFHTLGLGLRWYITGLLHPPMSNLYESLVFFIWGIILVYMYLEIKYKIHPIGIFAIIIALVGLGIASLSPNKEISPLMPALQSFWLPLHVFFASISYALFFFAAIFAVLFIIKNQSYQPLISLVFESFSLFCLLLTGGTSIFLFREFSLNKIMIVDGKVVGSSEIFDINGVNILFLSLFIVLLIEILALLIQWIKNNKHRNFNLKLLSKTSFLLYLMILIWLIKIFISVPEVSPASNPYLLGILLLGFFSSAIHQILFLRFEFILNNLPSKNLLDILSYRSILISFPLLTLVIVTGSIWAHYAWGRYWGWDPKETWSLITWFIYALYLHLRLQTGWKGQKIAFVAILGFFSVIFTYLGVNLLLPGLHSY